MTEEEKQRIRIMFVYIVKMLKSEAEKSAKLSSEVFSLIGAVRALDPAFDEVMEHRRNTLDDATGPANRASLDLYDEMIRQVENGEIL